MSSIRHNVIFTILNNAICQNRPYDEIMRAYDPYMDFYFSSYHLFYIYFLEQKDLEEFLQQLKPYADSHFSRSYHTWHLRQLYAAAVFKEFAGNYQDLSQFFPA